MMSLVNAFYANGSVARGEFSVLLRLLNPVAPHITEEMWQMIGEKDFLCRAKWPQWDEAALVKEEVEIAIQINGRIRGRMMVSSALTAEEGKATLMEEPQVKECVGDREIAKVVYVPGRLLNIVVR